MTMRTVPSLRKHAQAGLTLVELMVALVIGLFILLGLTILFANQSVSRTEIDKAGRQIENGRFALQTLVNEANLAGYYGALNTAPSVPGTMPDPCDTTLATVQSGMGLPVQGYAGASTDPTPSTCLTGYKANTAVLVVRRANTSGTALTAAQIAASGDYLIQVSGCQGDGASYILGISSTSYTLHQRTSSSSGCATPISGATTASVFPYYQRIYYITTCSNKTDCTATGADSVPTLRRMDVKPGGRSSTAIVDGIENLQIDYGIDTTCTSSLPSGDGAPDEYDAPPAVTSLARAACGAFAGPYWQDVVSLRLYVLARNIDSTGTYTDNKTYNLGQGASAFAPGGNYKRHLYEQVARLNNPAGRRE